MLAMLHARLRAAAGALLWPLAAACGAVDIATFDASDHAANPFTYYGRSKAAAIAAAESESLRWHIAREDDQRFVPSHDVDGNRVSFEVEDGIVVLARLEPDGRIEGSAEPDLRPYLGLTEADAEHRAEDADTPFRVTCRDGELQPVTADYRPDRVNVHVEGDLVVHASSG
jgi:hypothetical protein